VATSKQGEYPTTMQNREFLQFAAHWCFNYISRMPNWVRLKFGQQVNATIMLLHKKFQKNPHHHFGVMIKYLEATATGNEFVTPLSTSSQRQKEKTSKTTFSTFKQDENPHGVPGGPEFDAGIFEIS
jgi:hypothetical protein